MKKILSCLFAVASFAALFAQAPAAKPVTAAIKAEAAQPVVKADTSVTIQFKATIPPTHEFCQRSIFAYLPGLPEGFTEFAKKNKLKFNTKYKDPKWHSVEIDGRWLPYGDRQKTEQSFVLSVKGWPAGDYQISVSAYFQPRKKDPALKGVYRSTSFVFTIEK